MPFTKNVNKNFMCNFAFFVPFTRKNSNHNNHNKQFKDFDRDENNEITGKSEANRHRIQTPFSD